MSLRGSEKTEAISEAKENGEIAALPSVSRNDKRGLRHSLLGERIKVRVSFQREREVSNLKRTEWIP